MKYAVFSCIGLGDGLLSLVLSHNLVSIGHEVDTYHPFLSEMQPLFPNLPLFPRREGVEFLEEYDHCIFIFEKLEWMQKLIEYSLQNRRGKTTILNPIATPNRDYPFWEEGKFDGNFPFVENLFRFCKISLGIKNPTKQNGLVLPKNLVKRKYPKRLIFHPTSSREGKNWRQKQYLALARKLEKKGFEPVFILTDKEKELWPDVPSPRFPNLIALTKYIAESGWMIGNDSGIGHLASCIGIPTLTICRSKMTANFWRPSWSQGEVIVPPKWIPNLKGLRWRDKRWQTFVPAFQVEKAFLKFCKSCEFRN